MDSNRLEEFCRFGEDRVYLLMAIARQKENPEISSSEEIVFREVVKDTEDLQRKTEKLSGACNGYGEAERFRLYLSVNARNVMDCFFDFSNRMNDWVKHRFHGDEGVKQKFKQVGGQWMSQLQKPSSRDETFFLWDLDNVTEERRDEFISDLPLEPVLVQETPNGYHIVTETFNYNAELETGVEHELKTDGLLFLEYIQVRTENEGAT